MISSLSTSHLRAAEARRGRGALGRARRSIRGGRGRPRGMRRVPSAPSCERANSNVRHDWFRLCSSLRCFDRREEARPGVVREVSVNGDRGQRRRRRDGVQPVRARRAAGRPRTKPRRPPRLPPRGTVDGERRADPRSTLRPRAPQALQAYYLEQQGVREERARMAAAAMQTAALRRRRPAPPCPQAPPCPPAPHARKRTLRHSVSTINGAGRGTMRAEPAKPEPPKPAGPAGAVSRRGSGAA